MFKLILADTPELLKEVYRVRYQVYCVENQFEDPGKNPGGLERDEFDDQSVHSLLVDSVSNRPVGTVRLVMHRPGAGPGSLPFYRVCEEAGTPGASLLPYETTAECSRFAISKTFRRGVAGIAGIKARPPAGDGQVAVPHITIGLIAGVLRMCFAHGVTHMCAVMEPTLLRLLSRFGVHFQAVGPQVNYHGWRQPCFTKITTLMARIEAERQDVWSVVTDNGRLWPATVECPEVARAVG